MDKAEREAWAARQASVFRYLLLALSPMPKWDQVVGAGVGSSVIGLVVLGLITKLHWPEAALPIALLLLALSVIAGIRLQRRADAEGRRKHRLQGAAEIVGETFHIWDLIPEGGDPVIRNKVIRRCTILGPAVVVQRVIGEIGRNTVRGGSKVLPVWILQSPPPPREPRTGCIELFDVEITQSEFHHVGFVTTWKEARAKWKVDLPEPDPPETVVEYE